METLPVSNSALGMAASRMGGCGQARALASRPRPHPTRLVHLELASGTCGPEVLTLHDSLNAKLGFLRKRGREGGSHADGLYRGWWPRSISSALPSQGGLGGANLP